MHVYIIKTIIDPNGKLVDSNNNLLKTATIVGYTLLDIEDNDKIMNVTKQQLINAMKAKKIKIYNAQLHNGHIRGTYYSLFDLPFSLSNNITRVYFNNRNGQMLSLVALCKKVSEVTICRISFNNIVDVGPLDMNMVRRKDYVVNIDNNGDVLCESIGEESKKTDLRDLDKEAPDKSIVWSVEDFETYMKKHNWKYTLLKNYDDTYNIKHIDPNCTVVHLPYGADQINDLFEEIPVNLDTIVIPSSVRSIRCICEYASNDNRVTIKNILFQETIHALSFFPAEGLKYLNITGRAELPCSTTIHKAYNYCNFSSDNIEFYKNKFSDIVIDNCFCNCQFNNIDIAINSKSYRASFTRCSGINSVTIGEKITAIQNCLNRCNIKAVDFTRAKELKIITSSFTHNNITSLDLSCVEKLTTLGSSSFLGCESLSNVILPSELRYIEGTAFYGCDSLKYLKLPSTIESCNIHNNSGMTIEYPSNIHKITNYLIGTCVEKLIFAGKIEHIYSEAFNKCTIENLSDIDGLELVDTLDKASFAGAMIKTIDLRCMKLVTEIPDECFLGCCATTIILSDSITSIGAKAFKKCSKTKNIVIGPSVKKINATAFTDVQSSLLKIYVVKGSYAHKFLSKEKYNFNFVFIDSVDDAYDMIFNASMTPEEKRAKYKLIFNGTDMEKLLEDEYIKDISFTYKLIETLQNNNESTEPLVSIDKSKFRPMGINDLHRIEEIYSVTIAEQAIINNKITAISRFNALSNLFTTIYDNNMDFYTDQFKHVFNEAVINVSDVIYCVDNNVIMTMKIVISDGIRKTIGVLVIIEQGIIQFITLCDNTFYNNRITRRRTTMHLFYEDAIKYKNNVSIVEYLKRGDYISTDTEFTKDDIINNAKIPESYRSLVYETIYKSWVIIGTDYDFMNKKKLGKGVDVLYYDTLSGKFIETQCTFDANKVDARIDYPTEMIIRQVYNIDEYKSINSKYFDLLFYRPASTEVINFIKFNSMDKDELNRLKSDINNYDINIQKDLCTLADYIYEKGNSCANSKQLLDKLTATSLFNNDEPLSLKNLKDMKAEVAEMRQLDDNYSTLIVYKDYNSTYYFGIVNGDMPLNKKVFKSTFMKYSNLLKTLYFVGEARKNEGNLATNKITNDNIDTSKYIFLQTSSSNNLNSDGVKLNLCMDIYNCDCYIIGECWDMYFYKLFRLRDFMLGYDIIKALRESERIYSGNKKYIDELDIHPCNLARELKNLTIKFEELRSNPDASTSILGEVRNDIVKGLPNNYPYYRGCSKFFSLCCKQPVNVTF